MVFDLYIGDMAFFQTKHLWIKSLPDQVAMLMLDRDQSPANYLDPKMLDDLDQALDALRESSEFRLLIIRSAKNVNFCTGPSPAVLANWTAADFRAWARRGQGVCNKLATMAMPSACVISGGCVDAGLELALACDYRVVVDKPATQLGFAELEWGMIPCWGGTQRLAHLIGLDNSLTMLLAGQRLDARTAWQWGLADELTEDASEEPPAFLEAPVKRDWTMFSRRTWRERWMESNPVGRWFLFRGAERVLRTRIPDDMPAPSEMMDALRVAFQNSSLAPGMEFELQAMERIVAHPALHHLLRLLEHRDKLRVSPITSGEKQDFVTIGVNGAGTEGLSLLLHSLMKGHPVVLRVGKKEELGDALGQILQLLFAEVQRGTMSLETMQKLQSNISGTITWTNFDQINLLLDTVPTPLEEAQSFYRLAEAELPRGALIVSTTGLHRVEDLRVELKQPERVVGLHIIEPWNRGSVAEVTAPAIGPHNVQRVRNWAVGLGKYCLQIPDRAGGLVMRVWMPALNEAGILIKEGVPIDRIDQAMRRFGMSYGPCEWMDRIGIDAIAELVKVLQPAFAGRVVFESGFSLMRDKGWLGNRAEDGFYRPGLRKKKPNPEAVALWQSSQGEAAQQLPVLSLADSLLWIQRRLVTLTVIEAIRCLRDGIAADADNLDCAMCLTGWASHRGGPIGYARQTGVEGLRQRCEELANVYGARFTFPEQGEPCLRDEA
jgi:3-hydroxyacyl-CoA dehydrogenase/enoyl-CoA hydratase/3-hydroxybutyryl-CoA epimerase